ncbi:MAG: diguanylate cyclase [Desulfuromonadaceae bacterium]|nr:diguanylate cyclase [Desulfuromonadaceae bacterium]
MSLRERTLLILLMPLLIVLIVGAGLRQYVLSEFFTLEQKQFDKLTRQIERSILAQERQLRAFVKDYAIWDDSYRFIEDRNQEYLDSNLAEETLNTIGTRCIVYFDRNLDVRYRFHRDEDRALIDAVIQTLRQSWPSIQERDLESRPTFYLCLSLAGRPFLAALHPILPTERNQPSNGYLLMGEVVDDLFSQSVSAETGYDFELLEICNRECSVQHQDEDVSVRTVFSEDQYAQMIVRVKNIDGHCAFLLVTEVYHDTHLHLERVLNSVLWGGVLLGLLALAMVAVVLNRLLLTPLSGQIQRFNEINESGDLTQRFAEQGSGEILLLAKTINRTFETIQHLNERLQRSSETDSLTGLWNRRFFDHQLLRELQLARRQHHQLGVLMLDIDYFKLYNDTYGHQRGDECLKHVAQTIQLSLKRETDLAIRYGGEEFVVLLPDVSEEGALMVAERIRYDLSELKLLHAAAPKGVVSISIGIAIVGADRDESPESVVRKADAALYQAKQQGRDRIILWEEAP